MSGSFGRRSFLAGGASAAALAAGGGLLAACGSSGSAKGSGSSSGGTKGTPGVSNATPKRGGTLNIGVEAEDNGFNPTIASWDVTGNMYGHAIYDTLTAVDSNGKPQAYLAQSITPNADFTQWTLKLRPNVMFHDGSVCDANAVVGSLEANVHSPQNGFALTNVDSVTNPDASTVVIKTKTPWSAFPYYLSGAIGSVMAPAMLKAADGGNRSPIGTGPFVFKEWVPNDHFTATRNPHYWQSSLPYVDTVTFHPIPDHQSRENSLKAGQIDIMHTDDTQTAVDFMNDSSYQYINDLHNPAGENEQHFYMINTAVPPLDDIRVRQALAYSIDRRKVVEIEFNNLPPDSTGPFGPASPYHSDTGYPSYDLAKAKALVKAYEAEKGPVKFQLSTVNDAKDLAVTQLVQSMFQAAGMQATIVQVQQSQYIVQALLGQYGVREWRQYAAADPDEDYVWWIGSSSAPVGKIALNFARNSDPQLDAALNQGRTSADPATRKTAYETVAKRLATDIPYLWINQSIWSVIAKPNVMDFDNPVFPDGTKGLKTAAGFFDPRYIWLS